MELTPIVAVEVAAVTSRSYTVVAIFAAAEAAAEAAVADASSITLALKVEKCSLSCCC